MHATWHITCVCTHVACRGCGVAKMCVTIMITLVFQRLNAFLSLFVEHSHYRRAVFPLESLHIFLSRDPLQTVIPLLLFPLSICLIHSLVLNLSIAPVVHSLSLVYRVLYPVFTQQRYVGQCVGCSTRFHFCSCSPEHTEPHEKAAP